VCVAISLDDRFSTSQNKNLAEVSRSRDLGLRRAY